MPFDTIIKGGSVVDGSGLPMRTADVGIRDGMLASETIRQAASESMSLTNGTSNGSANGEDEDAHKYHELVVLDRAGRIHVPHDYLEQFNIKGHAVLEVTDEGILIRQAEQTVTEQVKVNGEGSMRPMGHAGAMTVKREKGKGGLFGRFRRDKE